MQSLFSSIMSIYKLTQPKKISTCYEKVEIGEYGVTFVRRAKRGTVEGKKKGLLFPSTEIKQLSSQISPLLHFPPPPHKTQENLPLL